MPTKSHRSGVSRHGRSTSASKISAGHSSSRLAQTAGLQFTHAKPDSRKDDKPRKAQHLTEANARASSPFRPASRNTSFQRTKSKEHIQPFQPLHKAHHTKRKPTKGFTIASNSSESDDDAWTSESASGAVSPAIQAQSDEEDSTAPLDLRKINDRVDLQRVDTARVPRDSTSLAPTLPERTPLQRDSKPLPESKSAIKLTRPPSFPQLPRIETQMNGHTAPQSVTQPPTPNSRPSKRSSAHRPPSVHSLTSHAAVRPHPLIRGPSFAEPCAATTSGASGSRAAPIMTDSQAENKPRSASPTTSLRSLASPANGNGRRTSVSSISTLPLPSTPNPASTALQATQQRDRQRTMSTISTSSAAGLSSIFHLPSLSRAPSPPHQMTKSLIGKRTKFPSSPFIHVREWGADVLALPDGTPIHPLLPAPYMQTHLSVLKTRSTFRESYERVRLARSYRRK